MFDSTLDYLGVVIIEILAFSDWDIWDWCGIYDVF